MGDQVENFKGVVIAESLLSPAVLKLVKILDTLVEAPADEYNFNWKAEWTKHTIEVSDDNAIVVASMLAKALDRSHAWYAEFKNSNNHYIVFSNKIFYINRKNPKLYTSAKRFGVSLGIPSKLLKFS